MIIVPESAIADLLTPAEALTAVERVFAAMAAGEARNFPVVREALGGDEEALYGFKGGVDASAGALGLKAGGYWPRNAERRDLANHQSTVFLFDPRTGRPAAMVGGNLLTALRTAAAAAASVRRLARSDARTLGLVGAGRQAAFQLRQVAAMRSFDRVLAWNRTPERLERLRPVADELGLAFEPAPLEGFADADVIVTIVSADAPVLLDAHVRPGAHVAAMGTDTKGKQEIDPRLLARASVFTDEVAQSVSIGEAQHAVADGLIDASAITPIGDVIRGAHPGRRAADEVTLFDGTGVGLQDLAVARVVVARAAEAGSAIEVEV